MSGNLLKSLTIITFLLMGVLYYLKWEREGTINGYADEIASLLDDRLNPTERNFSGRRARLCKVLTILQEAEEKGLMFDGVIGRAAEDLGMGETFSEVLVDSLADNYGVAKRMGLLDEGEQLDAMKAGELPQIAGGPYAGDEIDFEFIVPVDDAPELETNFANLKLQPATITRQLGVPFDKETYAKAGHFYRARQMSQSSYIRVGAKFEQTQRSL